MNNGLVIFVHLLERSVSKLYVMGKSVLGCNWLEVVRSSTVVLYIIFIMYFSDQTGLVKPLVSLVKPLVKSHVVSGFTSNLLKE